MLNGGFGGAGVAGIGGVFRRGGLFRVDLANQFFFEDFEFGALGIKTREIAVEDCGDVFDVCWGSGEFFGVGFDGGD